MYATTAATTTTTTSSTTATTTTTTTATTTKESKFYNYLGLWLVALIVAVFFVPAALQLAMDDQLFPLLDDLGKRRKRSE
jgi:hypothetical protein